MGEHRDLQAWAGPLSMGKGKTCHQLYKGQWEERNCRRASGRKETIRKENMIFIVLKEQLVVKAPRV